MAQLGRALRSGRRGRKFKSCRLDDTGLLVKRSRRRPLTAETRVRFPDRSYYSEGKALSGEDSAFFASGNQTEDCGSDVNRNIIRKLNIAVPDKARCIEYYECFEECQNQFDWFSLLREYADYGDRRLNELLILLLTEDQIFRRALGRGL